MVGKSTAAARRKLRSANGNGPRVVDGALRHADGATQKILMNLWFFEVNIDEAALIDLAARNEVAKQVLAELWKRERLSENGKQAIVKRFMTFRLVNDPPKRGGEGQNVVRSAVSTTSAFLSPIVQWYGIKSWLRSETKSTLTMEVSQAIVSCPCTKKAKNLAPCHGGRASQARRRQMRLWSTGPGFPKFLG